MSTDSLRVLVVHNRYRSGQPSGEDRVVNSEIGLLRAAGHDVTLFERRSDDIETMSLLERAMVPIRVPWNRSVRSELARQLREQRPDVVHIHNTFPLLSPSVVEACADVGVPAVATLHNYLQVCPRGTLYRNGHICTDCTHKFPLASVRHGCYRDSRLATVPLMATTLVHRSTWWSKVGRFFCISEAQRQTLVEAGMPADRLAVKHNFVVDPGVRRVGTGQHVLYLGRMAEEKGVRLLLAAWERLAAAGGLGIPLVLAGAGPLGDEVARWARDREDASYVGLLSPAESARLIACAAVVVAPSVWLETFGLAVVEAMAAGVPAVAAAHGAFVELIADGVCGALHRPGDAASLESCLRRVVLDADYNRALGLAARRRYETRFTPEIGLAALVGGYEAAIGGAVGCERVR